jgi:hypothetical protein
MISIRAKYDGKRILFSEKIEITKEEEVIVVFLNRDQRHVEDVSGTEIQSILANSGSLSFLQSENEDVYSDQDLKVKY